VVKGFLMLARENPFRSERIEGLAFRPEGFSLEGLVEKLAALGGRGAIVGPEGSGKTTLLESLAPHFQARGYGIRLLRLGPENWESNRGKLSADGTKRVLLVDGLESSSHPALSILSELLSRADWLVAAMHRPGLLPTLVELRTSPELLAELVRELLGDGESRGIEPELPGLFARHRGNLRACFRELYDRYAS
jgi:hypothetical protein